MLQTISKASTCVKRTDLPLTFRNWRPSHHEILLVELSTPDNGIVEISGTLHAIFANAITGMELCRYSINLGTTRLFAYPSHRFSGKHYIVRVGDYACSCWQHRTSGTCPCATEVREMVESQEVQYA
jgi:hypothetical protein